MDDSLAIFESTEQDEGKACPCCFASGSLIMDEENELYVCAECGGTTEYGEEEDGAVGSVCPNCEANDSLVEDDKNGFIVCTECGVICEDIIDHQPEWRNYGDDGKGDSVSRCSGSANPYLPNVILGTTIAGPPNRMKTINSWMSMGYRDRSLCQVYDTITRTCMAHNIKKNIIDQARNYFKTASDAKHTSGKNRGKYIIIRGSNRCGLIAACVYKACQKCNRPMSQKEVADMFNLTQKEVNNGLRTYTRLVGYQQETSNSPEHFVERLCTQLRIHRACTDTALAIARNVQRLRLTTDHTPPSVAAGCIYLMIQMQDLDMPKRDISKTLKISEVTITKVHKKIYKYRNILISDEKTQRAVEMLG